MDSTVALKYISKMGGRKPLLNSLAKQLWEWCESRNIWISAFHIPGKLNVRADELSRDLKKKRTDDMEWALHQDIYDRITQRMGTCDTDLFASSKNHKHCKYVTYLPDIGASAINAFSVTWNCKLHYVFPPFSVFGRVLQKMAEDQAELILVAPLFPSQQWFPQMLQDISGPSFVLPKTSQILYLPGTNKQHQLTTTCMRMGAFHLSGNVSAVRAYQQTLQTLSCSPGDQLRRNNMGRILKDGCSFVIKSKFIQLTHLQER